MNILTQSFISLAILLFSYRAYLFWGLCQRYRQLVKRHGCAEPSVDINNAVLGLDHLWHIFTFKGEDILDDLLVPRFRRLGHTYCQHILGQRTFHTSDARIFQTILGTAWESFEVGGVRKSAFHPFLRQSIICTDGAQWKRARELVKPSFGRSQLNDFEKTERHVQSLFEVMPTSPSSGWTDDVDISEKFFHLTIDTATEFFFGKSVESQILRCASQDAPGADEVMPHRIARREDKDFVKAFELVSDFTMQRALLQDLYFFKDGWQYRRSLAVVHKYADYFVDMALHRKDSAGALEKGGGERYIFLDEIAAVTKDPQELRDAILTLLLTGRDTTASLLGWVVFLLARHPKVYCRLRKEILSEVVDNDSAITIDYPKLKSLQYLQCVIHETLRLFAVITLTSRECTRDTILPTGGGLDGSEPIVIMKGEKIFLHIYAAHRRGDIWGQDATEFKPERWEKRHIGWDFIPFGGGPRVCVGQHYGLAEASFVLLRICQRFDKIRYTNERDNHSKLVKLTTSAGKGVRVQMHRATSDS